MIVDEFVGSTFLKAADLGTQTPTITVSKVEPVEFQDGTKKLVIHPSDPAINPIVLSMTNSRACVAAWGNDSDAWINKQAMLSVRQTQMGPGLGVTPINTAPQAQAPLAQTPLAQTPLAQTGQVAPPANPNQVNTGNADVPFDDKIPY